MTLPLSYSRLRPAFARAVFTLARYGEAGCVPFTELPATGATPTGEPARISNAGLTLLAEARSRQRPRLACLAVARLARAADRARNGGRRLVARGGFEPPKPLGRQIYSLLRLTASLPRR